MAVIKPFKAIRPVPSLASKVAAPPYDVLNSDEARKFVKDNPYSFLHVDKAEIDLDKDINLYDDKVYQKAKENLDNMIKDEVLIKDKEDCFYIYSLAMNGRVQTGLVVCTSIDEYLEGKIKKHELTREDKEQDRIKHVDTCNANTGPIFLAYREKKEISNIIKEYSENNKPVYNFVSDDNVKNIVWVIDDKEIIKKLIDLFNEVPSLYIADGHHRNASAVKVGLKRRKQKKDINAEYNYYLSVLFADNELYIMDYNRLVKDLNGLQSEEFLNLIKEKFNLEEVNDCYKPEKIHDFGMYLDNKWYKLTAKDEIIGNDPVSMLDVSILQKNILQPILNIDDPRTNERIDFVGGIRGLSELVRRVDSKEMKVAFSMYPTSMSELFSIADTNQIMPPKSTWFEPKLKSGLFIHSLE